MRLNFPDFIGEEEPACRLLFYPFALLTFALLNCLRLAFFEWGKIGEIWGFKKYGVCCPGLIRRPDPRTKTMFV